MKRIIALFLILVMLFVLCACSELDKLKEPEPTPVPVEPVLPEITPEPEPTPELEIEHNPIVIRTIEEFKSGKDPRDGQSDILLVDCRSPYVVIENNEEAAEKINDAIKAIDETFYTGEDYGFGSDFGVDINYYQALAEDNLMLSLSGIGGAVLPFKITRDFEVVKADEKQIRIDFVNKIDEIEYIEKNYSFIFDVVTGDTVAADEEDSEVYYYEKGEVDEMGGFTISKLADFEALDDKAQIIDLMNIDDSGDDYVIYNDVGSVFDFRLERVMPLADAQYELMNTYWYCSDMYNSGLQIRAKNFDDGSCLRLSYRSHDEIIENLLVFDESGNGVFKNAEYPDAVG